MKHNHNTIYHNRMHYKYLPECTADDYCLIYLDGVCLVHALDANVVEGWVETAIVANHYDADNKNHLSHYNYITTEKLIGEGPDAELERRPHLVKLHGKVVIIELERTQPLAPVAAPVYNFLIDERGKVI
ncbi:MAG: hypothetical protein KAS32_01700 [Candidatus Peribacteraceae bacterium]|nr:hypothetical protein [Candidatus Peribacteraceae bacterium]